MIGLLQHVSRAQAEVAGTCVGAIGRGLFEYVVAAAQARHSPVACGRFGADMQVTLTNDGPVTFWLRVASDAA